MVLRLSSVPCVGILETLSWLDDDGNDLGIEFAVCRAAGLSFLGLLAAPPQQVILVHHLRTRERLLDDVAAARARLGIPPETVLPLPLRVVGFSDGDRLSKTPFLLRLRRVADAIPEDLPPGLIVVLDALATPGIGHDWDGREAWGAAGGEGWPAGPLQWQRWFSAEARWQFLNVLTPDCDGESLRHFGRNAYSVARLEAEPYRLTEGKLAARLTRHENGYLMVASVEATDALVNSNAVAAQTEVL